MIKPTIGRVVLFHPSATWQDPSFAPAPVCAAIIAKVWSDNCVNLAVFDADGKSHSFKSVYLHPGDDSPVPGGGYYCEWMPYQKGQAAKTEALELAAAARAAGPTGY